jgi:hypothetical protein
MNGVQSQCDVPIKMETKFIYKWSLPLLVKIGEQIDYFNLSVVYDLEIYVPHNAIVIEYFCSMRDF